MLLPFDVCYCPQAAHVELIQLFNVTTVNGPRFTAVLQRIHDNSLIHCYLRFKGDAVITSQTFPQTTKRSIGLSKPGIDVVINVTAGRQNAT